MTHSKEFGNTSHIANASGALLDSQSRCPASLDSLAVRSEPPAVKLAPSQRLEYYKYDLYGKPTYFSSTSQPLNSSTYAVKDLFTGQRWIPELGLYDDRNRFMSPDLGRFLQPDPIGFKGDSSNLYRYCGNDWANRSDPMGLFGDLTADRANSQKERQDCSQAIAEMEKRSEVSVFAHDGEMHRESAREAHQAGARGELVRIAAELKAMGAKADHSSISREGHHAPELSDTRLLAGLENNRNRISADKVAKKSELGYLVYQYRNNSAKFEFYHPGWYHYAGSIEALHGTWLSHEINYVVIGEAAAAHHESLSTMDRLINSYSSAREALGGNGAAGGERLWARVGYGYYDATRTLEGGY